MRYEDLKRRLGTSNELEFARSTCSRSDVFSKIKEVIEHAGVDVDSKYLLLVSSMDQSTCKIEIKYVPVYYTTSIAKLSWKETSKDGKSDDHNEFVRFNSIMYHGQNDKNERINKLDILKTFGKENIKLHELPSSSDTLLLSGGQEKEELLLPSVSGYEAVEVLDVSLDEGDYYPLDNRYILSEADINKRVQHDLEQTKSYKRLQKQTEKWSNIEQIDTKVVLIPIAYVYIGSKVQLVNTANGEVDVQYELNPLVTDEVKKAKFIALPAIIITIILNVIILCMFIFTNSGPIIFNKDSGGWLPFRSFNGYIWVIILLVNIILSILAFPSRKVIVEKIENNKKPLDTCKSLSRFIYMFDFGDLILLLCIIQYAIS